MLPVVLIAYILMKQVPILCQYKKASILLDAVYTPV